MRKLKLLLKRFSVPITIIMVPHSRKDSLNIKMPMAVLAMLMILVCLGFVYTVSLTARATEYYVMKQKYQNISGHFESVQETIRSLKESDIELKKLLSLGSKSKVLDAVEQNPAGGGSIDFEELRQQINESMSQVSAIRGYLSNEMDLQKSTPKGWPVDGKFSSGYGMRNHPKSGRRQLHTGIDISAPSGTPVKATADGIVSFSNWNKGGGKVVVIEHGHGFTTVYAHNKTLNVAAGDKVKRGDLIASVGSTGNSTGTHLHYEVWKDGKYVNPLDFKKQH